MADVEDRLRDLSREFVEHHLPPLLGLLGEQGVAPEDQRTRADVLVRALSGASVADELEEEGRRQVVTVDASADPPDIQFNGEVLGEIDHFESLDFFEEPVAEILGLPRLRVGVVLQLRDDETLKRIRRRAEQHDNELVGLADIPSVVRLRLATFVGRVEQLINAWSPEDSNVDLDIDIGSAVEAIVNLRGGRWPSWEQLADLPLVNALSGVFRAQIDDDGSAQPSAQLLVEFCWESLDLSAQSLLQEAARQLRSNHSAELDFEHVFETLARLDSDNGEELSPGAADWSAFETLAEEWENLFRIEQKMLAWAPQGRSTPPLSVYEPPRRSVNLDEPTSLPWDYPLLCWSQREQQALRDLIEGHRQTIENQLDAAPDLVLSNEQLSETREELVLDDRRGNFEVTIGRGSIEEADRVARDFRRAFRAVYQTMIDQFGSMRSTHQDQLLQRLRSSYDGYFQQSGPVWQRRFESWESLDSTEAFELLAGQLRHLLGPRALLDPFESPGDPTPRSVPQFTFTMALPEGGGISEVGVPLTALRAAFDDAPGRIRLVAVPESDDEPCRWLGDRTLTLRSLTQQPTEQILHSIRDDAVGILVDS